MPQKSEPDGPDNRRPVVHPYDRPPIGRLGFWITCLVWLVTGIVGIIDIYIHKLPDGGEMFLFIPCACLFWVGIIVCVIGLIVDRNKTYGWLGILMTGMICVALVLFGIAGP